jgi:threonine aldolase
MKPQADPRRHFASDNYAGICPEAFAAMADANHGHVTSYGDDPWTARAAEMVRELFGTQCEVFFVFNGTAANSLALASVCQPHHAVICHEHAHVETGECGAPEFFTNGAKLILLPGANGKLDAASVAKAAVARTDVHFPKARLVTITQATEGGTVYSVDEVRAISEVARRQHLVLHMDGARFANAVAALGGSPREITVNAGVDILSFGGSKNGMAVGEAVVFFNRELAKEFEFRRKQSGQLASKGRFLAAPWIGMLQDGAWLRHAQHANAMAKRLESALRGLPELKFVFPVQTNGVFAKLPPPIIQAILDLGWKFYTHVNPDDCRFMCSWDTTESDVDAFAADIKKLLSKK